MPLTPKNRKEEWLQGLVDHETALTPKNRPEEWMKEIIDASGGGGGGGGVLVIHIQNNVMDKTWQEIYDHMAAGGIAMCLMCSMVESEEYLSVRQIFPTSCEQDPYESEFYVYFAPQDYPTYKATTADGYPSMSLG